MDILYFKNIVAVVAVILTFAGYTSYFSDILRGRTKPHIFSWFIWSLATSIIYCLQVSAGAGIGALVTLAVAIISFIIFILSLKIGSKNIHKIDIIFLLLALLSIPVWLVIKQPVISAIILSTIEMLGFLPTIRKSWNAPYTEDLSFYLITTVRHSLSIFALAQYNIITVLCPGSWVLANALFSLILIARRKKIN